MKVKELLAALPRDIQRITERIRILEQALGPIEMWSIDPFIDPFTLSIDAAELKPLAMRLVLKGSAECSQCREPHSVFVARAQQPVVCWQCADNPKSSKGTDAADNRSVGSSAPIAR